MPVDGAVRTVVAVAGRQHGVIGVGQLEQAGLGQPRWSRTASRSDGCGAVHRGVYLVGPLETAAFPRDGGDARRRPGRAARRTTQPPFSGACAHRGEGPMRRHGPRARGPQPRRHHASTEPPSTPPTPPTATASPSPHPPASCSTSPPPPPPATSTAPPTKPESSASSQTLPSMSSSAVTPRHRGTISTHRSHATRAAPHPLRGRAADAGARSARPACPSLRPTCGWAVTRSTCSGATTTSSSSTTAGPSTPPVTPSSVTAAKTASSEPSATPSCGSPGAELTEEREAVVAALAAALSPRS